MKALALIFTLASDDCGDISHDYTAAIKAQRDAQKAFAQCTNVGGTADDPHCDHAMRELRGAKDALESSEASYYGRKCDSL
jgi:hypothetical protein